MLHREPWSRARPCRSSGRLSRRAAPNFAFGRRARRTFTREGTYDAAATRLRDLAELGVSAIELMPLAAFDGARGWGYDGVAPFAPFAPYGTPDELRAFVAEAHRLGLAVILDLVLNHF